ncbi:hypothetical protein ACIQNU_41630 [Streptomyces sp. NPDC091292]|uniref:hypothetical protein n=1 Tax=Streptomyces sp. NPDC091292 TaxID=3365991 RepID=UPI0037FB5BF8
MGTANRIALYATVCAVLAYVTPLGQSLYEKVFPDHAVALVVEQQDSPCEASWVLLPGEENLRTAMWGDVRRISRWERDGRIVHANQVLASVSVRGNADKAVVIRDLTLTVVRRDTPAQGSFFRGGGCGGGEEPEFLVADLDTLPLNQEVPVSYLRRSPTQKAAREAAEAMGKPVSLPRQVTTDGTYSFSLAGRTQRYDVEWFATVTWWDGEEVRQQRIDNDGRPFRVSAAGEGTSR